MRPRLGLALLCLVAGCDSPRLIFLWRTFTHPTYGFSIRLPRSWDVSKDGALGLAVVARAPDSDGAFRTNLNVVASPRDPALTLEKFSDGSVRQLSVLFNQYEILGRARTKLGTLEAMELRARYHAADGRRLIRTVLALSPDAQFVLTLTTPEESEDRYGAVFDAVRRNFRAGQT